MTSAAPLRHRARSVPTTIKKVVCILCRDIRFYSNPAVVAAVQYSKKYACPLEFVIHTPPSHPENSAQKSFAKDVCDEFCTIVATMLPAAKVVQLNALANIYADTSASASASASCAAVDDSALIIKDSTPLTHDARHFYKQWNIEFDCHNIVPYWIASTKQEWSARTFRAKISKLLSTYLVAPPQSKESLAKLCEVKSPAKSPIFDAAQTAVAEFVEKRLKYYADRRNDPGHSDGQSGISKYLHMGVLWSLDAALLAKKSAYNAEFLEELIVRKELSDNFCYYNKNYLDFKTAAPSWAYTTLAEHAADKRDYTYTFAQLDAAKTHSTAWNVAQTELATTNRMHGYMRMFWAKKILEWSPSAESAYKIAHILNDKYELDGYDPNGYVGCLWSIGGLHDRAWGERKIFGKIRYMSEDSLKKKVSFDAYEKRVVAKK